MQRRVHAAGWGFVGLAVAAVAIIVTVGPFRAHTDAGFTRWVGWSAVVVVPLTALGILLGIWDKVAGGERRELVPAFGSSPPVPRRWLWISLGLFCGPLLALIFRAGNLVPAMLRLPVDGFAAASGLAACLAVAVHRLSARRQQMPLPYSLRTLLERQRELSQRHQYSYSVGSAPPVMEIYVEQRTEWLGSASMAGRVGRIVPLTLAQMLHDSPNAVVLADPGVGKSTAVAQVAGRQSAWWLEARRSVKPRDAPFGPMIPFLLPPDLHGCDSLPAAMARQWEQLTGGRIDPHAFERKPPCAEFWLLLIDGIDQILSTPQRVSVVARVGGWVAEPFSWYRFMVTSRPLLSGELGVLKAEYVGRFMLRKFDSDGLRRFAGRWAEFRKQQHFAEMDIRPITDEEFIAAVRAASLLSLARVPLIATITALILESDRETALPTSRAGLYERFVLHLLSSRRLEELRTDIPAQFALYGKPGRRAWIWLLDHVRDLLEGSADMHLSVGSPGVMECARKWAVGNAPTGLFAKVPTWDDALRGLLTATSLIVPGPHGMHFAHPSLAEYLAAGPRSKTFDPETWLADARSPDSRSLALFVLARQSDAAGAPSGAPLAESLAELLLDRGGAETCIAGEIIADGIEVTPTLRDRVVNALLDKLKQDDMDASQVLGTLINLTSRADVLHRLAEFAEDPAQPDWLRADVADELCAVSRDKGIRLFRGVLDSTDDPLLQDQISFKLLSYGAETSERAHSASHDRTAGTKGKTSSGVRAGYWYRQIAQNSGIEPGRRLRAMLAMAERRDPGWSAWLEEIIAHSMLPTEARLDAARRIMQLAEPETAGVIRQIAERQDLALEVRVPLLAGMAEEQDEYARQILNRLDRAGGEQLRERFPFVAASRLEIGARSSEPPGELARQSARSVPAIWGGVPARSMNFTGRDEALERLRQSARGAVAALVPGAARTQAVQGLGGVGKTAIAIEYAYRYQGDYDLVWWIGSDEPARVRSSLASLAQHLGLEEAEGASPADATAAVLDALRRGEPYRRWLLIFDNAGQPEELGEFIPQGPGDVLITSRNNQWHRLTDTVEIDTFTRPESKVFLTNRVSGLTEPEADQLAEELGDLPLALVQAGAMLAESGMPVNEYLQLLHEQVTEIMTEGRPAAYPRSVAAAWRLSVDSLRQKLPQAEELLRHLAFFAPGPIPKWVFRPSEQITGTRIGDLFADPILVAQAISGLGRFALIRIDGPNITVHRLIQALVRDELNPEEQASYRHEVHLMLAGAAPGDPADEGAWTRYRELLPHVISPVTDLAHCKDPGVRSFALVIMRYLNLSGEFTTCQDMAGRFIAQWTEDSGPEEPQVVHAQRHLSDALRQLGQYPQARQVTETALNRARHVVGEQNPLTLALRAASGADLRARGDFAAARTFDEHTRKLHENVLGPTDPLTIRATNDLAVDYLLNSDYRKATELLEHVLFMQREAATGVSATEVSTSRTTLAWAIRLCGRFTDARDLAEDARDYSQEQLGPEHYQTLRAASGLSIAQRCVATPNGEALETASRVFTAFQQRFGESHPDTIAAAMNLTSIQRVTGQAREALELARRTVARCRDLYGPDHPYTYGCTGNLALLHRASGDPGGALELDDAALTGLDQRLSRNHHYSLTVASNLANDLAALNDITKARALGEDTLARLRMLLGEDHPLTLGCAANLVLDLRADGAMGIAEQLATDTMNRYAQTLGPGHNDSIAAATGTRFNADFDPLPI